MEHYRVLGPADGLAGFLGSIGVRFMVNGSESGGGFSLVEHPMSARALAAPFHRHTREDEYSYVIQGRYFGELVKLGGSTRLEPPVLRDLAARYGLEVDPKSIPQLVQRFGLRFPGEPL